MRSGSLVAIAALTVALCSCSSSSSSTSPTPAAGAVTQAIGPEGGKIEVGGAVVTFPKGAVAASTSVTISVLDTTPEGFVTLSKLFKCEPSGIDFAQPVEMRMPFVDDGSGGSLFWSSGSDPAFKDLGGKVEGNIMVATVQHFSSGFVGRKK